MLKLFSLFFLALVSINCNANTIQVSVINHESQPVENIVVYLETASQTTVLPENTGSAVTINQKSKAFAPYISVIQKNQLVEFVNQDDITHHIFSASRKHGFSFRIRSGERKNDIQFVKSGQISMGCNIHDWMNGYLLVLDTPYFSKTDQRGTANFNLTTKGEVKIHIWHPQLAENAQNTTQTIHLSETANSQLVFRLMNPLEPVPEQESGDDFDFLDDY